MLSVTITEKDGPSTTTTFDKTEVLIGRVKGNDVVLPKSNISKRHSRIVVKDGKIILIDLKSTNGTFINGQKINGPHVMQEGDKVFIGDFTLEVRETGGGSAMGSGQGNMGPGAGMPSFGGTPSAASLPSINGGVPHLGGAHMPSLSNVAPAYGRPTMSNMPPAVGAPSMNPPMGPGLGANVPPMGPGLSPAAPAAPMGPGLGANVPPMGPGLGANVPPMGPGLGANVPPMGPGLGANVPPMGPGLNPAAPAAPMGPGVGGPALGMPAPAPAESGMPSLGVSGSGVSAPSLGTSAIGPASVGAAPSLGAAPSGNRPLPSPGPQKPSGSSEGLIDKSLRLPGSNASERASSLPGSGKNLGASRQNPVKKDIGTAALPEEIVVDDARTPESMAWLKAARIVMDNYLAENDFQSLAAMPYPPEPETQDACYNKIVDLIQACRSQLGNINTDTLADFLPKEICGLGAVDSLIDDADVSAFNVYNFETIVVERKGRREISELQFTTSDMLYLIAQRLLAFVGMTPQNAPAVTEVRFGDGTQIEVVIPPVSVASTALIVRKTNHEFHTTSSLLQREMLSPEMAKFLNLCVKARRNILIVGAQCSGRTTLLNAIGAEIPDGERIVTVENSAVLVMPQLYVINLEAQNASFGQGGDLASLVRQASRMRAERILADSIQTPAEASAFVSAICAGAQGSIATMSSLNANEGFEMFKRMVSSVPEAAGLAGNIDIVITVRAFTDAKRRIVEIAEVVSKDNDLQLVPIFAWTNAGMGNMAMGEGQFKALGNIPNFYRELENGGMALDPSIFNP